MTLNDTLVGKSLVVCVGSGGVGKTSTAAVIGLRAALEGRRVLVLTIDPARRLANSLGLREFGNEETEIDLSAYDIEGELWALMLDTQSTFDELMGRMSPDEETRQRILSNPIYRTLSDTFASSQEYMASEKLYDVVSSERFDLVVLDTPPVKNALDFLEAPGRLSRFFDKKVIHWFLSPYEESRVLNPLVKGTSAVIYRLLGYIFGKEFLQELSEFLQLFAGMYDSFRQRHEEVIALFQSDETTFVTVCTADGPSSEVASYFAEELSSRGYPCGGVVVNQVHHCRDRDLDALKLFGDRLEDLGDEFSKNVRAGVLARLGSAHARYRDLAVFQKGWVDEIRGRMGNDDRFLVEVPRLEREVHDLTGLIEMGEQLFGTTASTP